MNVLALLLVELHSETSLLQQWPQQQKSSKTAYKPSSPSLLLSAKSLRINDLRSIAS